MRKVLIISYHYPPNPGVGGLRVRGLTKFLPEFGWEPIVITRSLKGEPDGNARIIQTAYDDVIAQWRGRLGFSKYRPVKEQMGSSSMKSRRSFREAPFDLIYSTLAFPDEQRGWSKYAIDAAKSVIKSEEISVILSSSPPATCHQVASNLNLNHKIPWVADLRDPWTQNFYYPYGPVRKFVERNLEMKTLGGADALTTVTGGFKKVLSELHSSKCIMVIPNGFDPDEMVEESPELTTKFSITYTGKLYGGRRDPSKLFNAVSELIEEGLIDIGKIDLRFYGKFQDWLDNEARTFGLEDVVRQMGEVPRKEAISAQRESQLLLMLVSDSPDSIGICPAKVFEYLASRRPILAIGGVQSPVRNVLEQTEAGRYTSDLDSVKNVLRSYYTTFLRNGNVPYEGDPESVGKYSQRIMAKSFSELFDEIT